MTRIDHGGARSDPAGDPRAAPSRPAPSLVTVSTNVLAEGRTPLCAGAARQGGGRAGPAARARQQASPGPPRRARGAAGGRAPDRQSAQRAHRCLSPAPVRPAGDRGVFRRRPRPGAGAGRGRSRHRLRPRRAGRAAGARRLRRRASRPHRDALGSGPVGARLLRVCPARRGRPARDPGGAGGGPPVLRRRGDLPRCLHHRARRLRIRAAGRRRGPLRPSRASPLSTRDVGPEGFITRVASQLRAYTWNLLGPHSPDFRIQVEEFVVGQLAESAEFRSREQFAQRPIPPSDLGPGRVLEEDAFQVEVVRLITARPAWRSRWWSRCG